MSPVRSRCANPGCNKPLPPIALQHGDPYCSSSCCRQVHGVVFKPITEPAGRPRKL